MFGRTVIVFTLAIVLLTVSSAFAQANYWYSDGSLSLKGQGVLAGLGFGVASFTGSGAVRAKGAGMLSIPVDAEYWTEGNGTRKPGPTTVTLAGRGAVCVKLVKSGTVTLTAVKQTSLEVNGSGSAALTGSGFVYAVGFR